MHLVLPMNKLLPIGCGLAISTVGILPLTLKEENLRTPAQKINDLLRYDPSGHIGVINEDREAYFKLGPDTGGNMYTTRMLQSPTEFTLSKPKTQWIRAVDINLDGIIDEDENKSPVPTETVNQYYQSDINIKEELPQRSFAKQIKECLGIE